MTPNKYKPHIFVLPEDDATRQIASGFLLNLTLNDHVIKVLPPVGGWSKVVEEFANVHADEMQRYPERRIVLLIDFDSKTERLSFVKDKIPEELSDRVFVLGVWSEPEVLKTNLKKNLEDIGRGSFSRLFRQHTNSMGR